MFLLSRGVLLFLFDYLFKGVWVPPSSSATDGSSFEINSSRDPVSNDRHSANGRKQLSNKPLHRCVWKTQESVKPFEPYLRVVGFTKNSEAKTFSDFLHSLSLSRWVFACDIQINLKICEIITQPSSSSLLISTNTCECCISVLWKRQTNDRNHPVVPFWTHFSGKF